jgi:hypothetical protein
VPPFDPLRVGEHVHGHLGWLSAVALLHPAILLRRAKRFAHVSVVLAVMLVTAAGALGVALYTPYRETLRQPIFVEATPIGFLFERKEHLAFGAVSFAWAGALAYFGALHVDGPACRSLRRAAHWAFIASAGLAIVAAVLGTIVASFKSF